MSTQEEQARPATTDETEPERPVETQPRKEPGPGAATTPHEGTSKTVDPEELSPDDFE